MEILSVSRQTEFAVSGLWIINHLINLDLFGQLIVQKLITQD